MQIEKMPKKSFMFVNSLDEAKHIYNTWFDDPKILKSNIENRTFRRKLEHAILWKGWDRIVIVRNSKGHKVIWQEQWDYDWAMRYRPAGYFEFGNEYKMKQAMEYLEIT